MRVGVWANVPRASLQIPAKVLDTDWLKHALPHIVANLFARDFGEYQREVSETRVRVVPALARLGRHFRGGDSETVGLPAQSKFVFAFARCHRYANYALRLPRSTRSHAQQVLQLDLLLARVRQWAALGNEVVDMTIEVDRSVAGKPVVAAIIQEHAECDPGRRLGRRPDV